MGLEANCRATWNGRSGEGRARLEEQELHFRGGFQLKIPFRDMTANAARGGRLTVTFPGGTAAFDLGAQAETWALKIRYPRSLMDKLGVKEGMRVSVIGALPEAFWRELDARNAAVSRRARAGSAIVFAALREKTDLGRLADLREAIAPDGVIWVIWRKSSRAEARASGRERRRGVREEREGHRLSGAGSQRKRGVGPKRSPRDKTRPELREDDVRAFATAHGLVDVKVASVSEELSGLKLVIPVAQRQRRSRVRCRGRCGQG